MFADGTIEKQALDALLDANRQAGGVPVGVEEITLMRVRENQVWLQAPSCHGGEQIVKLVVDQGFSTTIVAGFPRLRFSETEPTAFQMEHRNGRMEVSCAQDKCRYKITQNCHYDSDGTFLHGSGTILLKDFARTHKDAIPTVVLNALEKFKKQMEEKIKGTPNIQVWSQERL